MPELKALAPEGNRRMSANPHANGGLLRKDLKLPDFRDYAVEVPARGTAAYENTKPLGEFLRDVMKNNPTSFRVFGPDETASNRLQAVYEASKKTWMADMLPEDADGGELAPRRARDGDALGAHAARLAGGLSAHRAGMGSSTPTKPSPTSSIRCSTSTPSGWTSARTTCRGAPRSRRRTSCCRPRSGGRTTTGSRIRIPGSSTW